MKWTPFKIAFRYLCPEGDRAGLTIMIFHRVGLAVDSFFPEEATQPSLDAFIAHIVQIANVLPLDDAVALLKKGRLPERAVSITFDDGHQEDVSVVLPILRKYCISATFFIAPVFSEGTSLLWNVKVSEALRYSYRSSLDLSDYGLGCLDTSTVLRRRAAVLFLLRSIKYFSQSCRDEVAEAILQRCGNAVPVGRRMITPAQIKILSNAGMDIGAHAVNHPIFAAISPQLVREEIFRSREILLDLIRVPVPLFAYPNGKAWRDFLWQHVGFVKEAGFLGAVTTHHGVARQGCDPYLLPRFTPWSSQMWRVSAKLLVNACQRGDVTQWFKQARV